MSSWDITSGLELTFEASLAFCITQHSGVAQWKDCGIYLFVWLRASCLHSWKLSLLICKVEIRTLGFESCYGDSQFYIQTHARAHTNTAGSSGSSFELTYLLSRTSDSCMHGRCPLPKLSFLIVLSRGAIFGGKSHCEKCWVFPSMTFKPCARIR